MLFLAGLDPYGSTAGVITARGRGATADVTVGSSPSPSVSLGASGRARVRPCHAHWWFPPATLAGMSLRDEGARRIPARFGGQ